MSILSSHGGMIVVFEEDVTPELRRLARKHSLVILEAEAAEQALSHIRGTRPWVVIVQLGPEGKEALRFIGLATSAARRVPLVVATTEHSIDLERLAWRAGAKYYAPGVAPALLEPLLRAIMPSEIEQIEG